MRALPILAALLTLAPAVASAQCIDEAIRDELNARRRHRGVQKRDFVKAGRHELSGYGGWYASDLLSSTFVAGAQYTFHVTEELGLEATFGYTRAHDEIITIVEDRQGVQLVRDNDTPVYLWLGSVVFSPVHGKFRWLSGAIGHFDLHFLLGAGVSDGQTTRGLTFAAGFGFKVFLTRWLALRIDLRDHIVTQEILGQSRVVNDLLLTSGLSLFFPFGF